MNDCYFETDTPAPPSPGCAFWRRYAPPPAAVPVAAAEPAEAPQVFADSRVRLKANHAQKGRVHMFAAGGECVVVHWDSSNRTQTLHRGDVELLPVQLADAVREAAR